MICGQWLNGLLKDCESNQGGLSEIWISSKHNPLTLMVEDGVITYITDGSFDTSVGNFTKYEFNKGNASMTSTLTLDNVTNQHYVSTDLQIKFPKLSTEKRLEIENLVNSNDLVAIVKDNNGKYWYLGKDCPMTVTASNGASGSKKNDYNGFSITLNCSSLEYPLETTYLPWSRKPKPPRPVVDDSLVYLYGTSDGDVTDASKWYESDDFVGSGDYVKGDIVTISYQGTQIFEGWFDGNSGELFSQFNEFTLKATNDEYYLVAKTVSPLPPPRVFCDVNLYGTYSTNVKDENEWFEDEKTLIGTDGYLRGTDATIKYVGSYIFNGWYNGLNGELLSKDKEFTFTVINRTNNIIAKLSKPQTDNEIWYKTSNNASAQTTYTDGIQSLNVMGLESNVYSDGNGKMKFSEDVTVIGRNAFRNCATITSVTLPKTVSGIAVTAFGGCTNLTSIEIPKTVTSIGNGAFGNVPTKGTLYCYESWFDNLSEVNKVNLGNVYGWTVMYLEEEEEKEGGLIIK